MEYEDTSSQEYEQKKLVIRRDKVVVTKVTEQELSQIKESWQGYSATSHCKGFPTGNWTVCVSLRPAARTW